ncbi:MAG: hypothetical protein Q9198_001119 [Flavoplaca austrocitrina]
MEVLQRWKAVRWPWHLVVFVRSIHIPSVVSHNAYILVRSRVSKLNRTRGNYNWVGWRYPDWSWDSEHKGINKNRSSSGAAPSETSEGEASDATSSDAPDEEASDPAPSDIPDEEASDAATPEEPPAAATSEACDEEFAPGYSGQR